jgi:hypothetical protein
MRLLETARSAFPGGVAKYRWFLFVSPESLSLEQPGISFAITIGVKNHDVSDLPTESRTIISRKMQARLTEPLAV